MSLSRAATLVIAMLVVGACDSKPRRAKKLSRKSDAAPVVVTERGAERLANLVDEAEPNDDIVAVKPVALPLGVRGSMATETDVDVYAFRAASDGMLSIALSGVADADLRLEVLGKDGKARYVGDRGPAGTAEVLPNIPVTKGQVVRLAIREFISKREQRSRKRKKSKARAGASKPYTLEVRMVSPERGDEIEPNERAADGLALRLGDRGRGFFGWGKDIDWWRVSLEGFGAKNGFDLDVRGPVNGKLAVRVTTRGGETVIERAGGKGQGVFLRSLQVPSGAGEFRVRVSSSRAAPTQTYELHATSRRLEDHQEVEPNDDRAHATSIRASVDETRGEFQGHLVPGDRDVLVLSAPREPSILDITFDPSATVDGELAIRIGGETVAAINNVGVGATERSGAIPVAAGQNITLVITGRFSGDQPSAYKLGWSLESGSNELE